MASIGQGVQLNLSNPFHPSTYCPFSKCHSSKILYKSFLQDLHREYYSNSSNKNVGLLNTWPLKHTAAATKEQQYVFTKNTQSDKNFLRRLSILVKYILLSSEVYYWNYEISSNLIWLSKCQILSEHREWGF